MAKKITNGILATLGFLLSPLSWWNDIFINLPLAYAFGSLFGLMSDWLFLPAVIVGYWMTNVLGFILMHRGVKGIFFHDEECHKNKRDFLKDLVISILYTGIVVLLICLGWLKAPLEYFNS